NDGPFAGRESRKITGRNIKERLERELMHNVALRVEDTPSPDSWKVVGRGELQLCILLEQMRRYGSARRCRHRALSEHFGQTYPRENCEACDVCLNETEGVEDATQTAQKILSCVARFARTGAMGFGVTHLVDVLAGAHTEAVRSRGHDQLSTYGLLRDAPRKALTNWIHQLVDQGFLDRTPGDRPVLQLNAGSWEVMRGERTVRLIRAKAEPVKRGRAAVVSWEGVIRGLFDHLRGVRRELAERDGVPAFLGFGRPGSRRVAACTASAMPS
ncbi:MAG: RQC domain-containing protein, partial [Phycisphaerae bacterium]